MVDSIVIRVIEMTGVELIIIPTTVMDALIKISAGRSLIISLDLERVRLLAVGIHKVRANATAFASVIVVVSTVMPHTCGACGLTSVAIRTLLVANLRL